MRSTNTLKFDPQTYYNVIQKVLMIRIIMGGGGGRDGGWGEGSSERRLEWGGGGHYVSVNSKPEHPLPRAIFLMGEFPTPGQKKSSNPPVL